MEYKCTFVVECFLWSAGKKSITQHFGTFGVLYDIMEVQYDNTKMSHVQDNAKIRIE